MGLSTADFSGLRHIGWPWSGGPEEPAWRQLWSEHPQAAWARVVEQHRTGYILAEGPETCFRAESLPEWQRRRFPAQRRAAVGDWVLHVESRIVALAPRHTGIKRAAAGEHYQQQLIAANVDTVFVVCGLDADFNPSRIERYLMLVNNGGAAPVVVLTKADLSGADASAAMTALADVTQQRTAVVSLNAKNPADVLAVLRPWLGQGRTVALVGSSGVGKSTLINTLLGEGRMRTGEVRGSDSKGRHTTTHRALVALASGACLIDTPGMRELKPTGEEALTDGFADVEELATHCRFRDCSHRQEPGCAVRQAVERGILDPRRLANYLKLRNELADAADRLIQRMPAKDEPVGAPKPARGKRERR
jgi:ribosome biogenesis GTPase